MYPKALMSIVCLNWCLALLKDIQYIGLRRSQEEEIGV